MQNNYRLHSSTVLCVHINAAQFLHQHTPSVFNSHFIILPPTTKPGTVSIYYFPARSYIGNIIPMNIL